MLKSLRLDADVPLEEMEKRLKEDMNSTAVDSRPIVPDPQTVTYLDHEDLSSLAADTSGAPHIRQLSSNAWVGCGDDIYVLECMGKGHLRIEPYTPKDLPEDVEAEPEGVVYSASCSPPNIYKVSLDELPRYKGMYTPASLPMVTAMVLKLSPFRRSQRILTASTLAEAVKGCDTYANKIVKGPLVLG